jgi:hypothetical protein
MPERRQSTSRFLGRNARPPPPRRNTKAESHKAYDRHDTRRGRDFDRDRERFRRDERGFFERAGDEVASWFGDEEAERRRREDERMSRASRREDDRYNYGGWGREREIDRDRYAYRGARGETELGRFEGEERQPRSSRDYDRLGYAGYEHDFTPRGWGASGIDRGYAPTYVGGTGYTGGYSGFGYGAGSDRGYGSGGWGGAFTGSDYDFDRGRGRDRDYQAWRQRQLDELDRDYDEYRAENRERFEREFGSWRQNRQQKRNLLGQIREHMDVVGSDDETVGKVDCVRGDHIVLTKSDSPDNRHHALSCGMIDSIEGDQVRLAIPAEEARSRWKEGEDRGFFGPEREGEDVNLERSFAGTYR